MHRFRRVCREEPQYEGLCVSTETNLRAPAGADRFGEAAGICCGTRSLTQPKQKLLWERCDRRGGPCTWFCLRWSPSHLPPTSSLRTKAFPTGKPRIWTSPGQACQTWKTGKAWERLLSTLDSAVLPMSPEWTPFSISAPLPALLGLAGPLN